VDTGFCFCFLAPLFKPFLSSQHTFFISESRDRGDGFLNSYRSHALFGFECIQFHFSKQFSFPFSSLDLIFCFSFCTSGCYDVFLFNSCAFLLFNFKFYLYLYFYQSCFLNVSPGWDGMGFLDCFCICSIFLSFSNI